MRQTINGTGSGEQDDGLRPRYIVAIGASAGGLVALDQFFDNMPPDSGTAFVIIQHLSPDFKSLMDDLLARHTKMAIHRVSNGMQLRPDSVYLIPPKARMTVSGDRLFLSEKGTGPAPDLPIDIFFRSLAEDAGQRAIAIVLSGTGSDGSRGIVAVHEAGGLVLVQDIESAQFDGMPRSSLATGVVDYELIPDEMPQLIMDYLEDPEAIKLKKMLPTRRGDPSAYSEVFYLLKQRFNLDFSKYRSTTVGRRIERRMSFRNIQSIHDYVHLLVGDSEELDNLYKDLLIGVTEFFRDPPAFRFLQDSVLPNIIKDRPSDEEVRVWSAACATGEEAYSLAILLDESAKQFGFKGKITVFATDVHKASLEFASVGLYDKERLKNVSTERLENYFRKEGDQFRVKERLRKMVVFAPHNLVSDPPFTRMDLVTCRNLLIYLKPEVQHKILTMLHFALHPNGVLFLGASEGLGKLSGEFEAVNMPFKMFRKVRDVKLVLDMSNAMGAGPGLGTSPLVPTTPRASVSLDRRLVNDYDELLRRYMPPGMLINEKREVLHYFGEVDQFVVRPDGRFENDILKIIVPEMQVAVGSALHRAMKGQSTVVSHGLGLRSDGGEMQFDLSIEPIPDKVSVNTHYLIAFKHQARKQESRSAEKQYEPTPDLPVYQQRVTELEQELQFTKENLQTTVEELQTSNEELQATNEELLAANEELQSTNEELHSVNEELYTVNSEFELKNKELQQLNLDHDHLLSSIQVGIIFLDRDTRIRKYNQAVTQFFKLMPQDIGRPIDHIAYHLANQQQMLDDVRKVIATGSAVEKEVSTRDGKWLLKRVLPFRGESSEVGGAVLTYTDITGLKESERRLAEAKEDLERRVAERTEELTETNLRLEEQIVISHRTSQDLLATQEQLNLALSSGNIAWWIWDFPSGDVAFSAEKATMTGYTPEEYPRNVHKITELIHPDDYERTMQAMRDHLEGRAQKYDVEYRIRCKDGSYLWFRDNGRIISRDRDGKPVKIAGVVVNQQAQKMAEESLLRANKKLTLLSSITRHDILNKLMVIQGSASLIQNKLEDGKARERLSAINEASKDIKGLIDFTRTYERLGTDKPQWLDVGKVVEKVATLGLLQGIKLDHKVSGLRVLADTMFEKVIYNLIENSIRHGGEVTNINLSYYIAPEGLVLVYEDNGRGVPEDEKELIFKNGFGNNSGFGLFLSQEILDITNIAMRETGVPGKGARFEMVVPKAAYTVPA